MNLPKFSAASNYLHLRKGGIDVSCLNPCLNHIWYSVTLKNVILLLLSTHSTD